MTDHRPFAVVTGGSNGIGLELARQFIAGGYDVLIAGEDPAHLVAAKHDLASNGSTITTHASDLATEDGVGSLIAAIGARAVDALCVNAGVGLGGKFVETDLQTELRMIDLNCRGAVQLTKPIARDMAARGAGKILITSSIAATMADPFEAVYGATKVFLRWFSESLREELRGTGVTVTALMPSTTETNFFKRADMMTTKAGTMDKDGPAIVAKAGYDALMAGHDKAIPTIKNKVIATVAGMMSDTMGARQHRALSEPGSANAKSSNGSSGAVPIAAVAAAGIGLALFAGWHAQKVKADADAD